MPTILKTGINLELLANAHIARDIGLEPPHANLHGDLHIVGKCAILYYPPSQPAIQRKSDGLLSMDHHDYFHRAGERFSILVIPAKCISLRAQSLWGPDIERWLATGGELLNGPKK